MHFGHIPALISQHALYQPPVKVWEVSAQPSQIIFCIQPIHIISFTWYPWLNAHGCSRQATTQSPSTPMLPVDA